MILTRGIGVGGALVTAGLALGLGLGSVPEVPAVQQAASHQGTLGGHRVGRPIYVQDSQHTWIRVLDPARLGVRYRGQVTAGASASIGGDLAPGALGRGAGRVEAGAAVEVLTGIRAAVRKPGEASAVAGACAEAGRGGGAKVTLGKAGVMWLDAVELMAIMEVMNS